MGRLAPGLAEDNFESFHKKKFYFLFISFYCTDKMQIFTRIFSFCHLAALIAILSLVEAFINDITDITAPVMKSFNTQTDETPANLE